MMDDRDLIQALGELREADAPPRVDVRGPVLATLRRREMEAGLAAGPLAGLAALSAAAAVAVAVYAALALGEMNDPLMAALSHFEIWWG